MFRTALSVVVVASLVAGCKRTSTEPEYDTASDATPVLDRGSEHGDHHGDARALRRQVEAVRRVTARFRSFKQAQRAGYTVKVTDCFENQPAGGMGYHFAKGDLLDGNVEMLKPEVLLYEPIGGGRVRLVGVEYIVPFTAWNQPEPPSQFGMSYHRNETFQVWALHFWIWKDNPSGLLSDWNPRVSCARDNPPLP